MSIYKRIDKVKNQDGMYLVFCTKTFEPIFLTNIDNQNIIMDSIAMNAGFQGVELNQADKFYYLKKILEYYNEDMIFSELAKFEFQATLGQVTLDYLNILRDSPIIDVDEAFMAFVGSDQELADHNYLDPVSLPVLFDVNSENSFTKKLKKDISWDIIPEGSIWKKENHTW